MPRQTKGQKLADELRARCNTMTKAERERALKIGMRIINQRRSLLKRLAES